MLLLVGWQSFITQTHQHFASGAFAVGTTADARSPDSLQSHDGSPANVPAACLICREIAHAGTYLLPAPLTLEAPPLATFWVAVAILLGLTLAQSSHAWQSRAPPHRLQA
jgi:hypothetical protein